MAQIEVKWTKSESISIRDYGKDAGFNLSMIDIFKIPQDQRIWIQKKIVGSILADLDYVWEDDEWNTPLSKVKKGIYVISLSGGICIDYRLSPSQVIYIGRGQIRSRIYNHLKNWVAHFSESLQDIKLKFWMSEIKKNGSSDAFKAVESQLLIAFHEKHGEIPIMNKRFGDSVWIDHFFNKELTKPFKIENAAKRCWKIKPMPENEWFLTEEEI